MRSAEAGKIPLRLILNKKAPAVLSTAGAFFISPVSRLFFFIIDIQITLEIPLYDRYYKSGLFPEGEGVP